MSMRTSAGAARCAAGFNGVPALDTPESETQLPGPQSW